MANIINSGKVYKEFGVKTGENTSEFFEIGADAKNVFIQNAEHTQYGDADGIVDLQTKLDSFNKSVRNIGSGVATKAYAAAFGQSTQANGQSSHSEGYQTIADGDYSHTEGYRVFAQGEGAHAEGYYRRGIYLRITDGQEGYLLLDQNKTNLPNWLNGYYWDASSDSEIEDGGMPLQGLKLYDVQNISLLKATILETYTVENNGSYDLYAILDTDLKQEIENDPDRGYYLYYGKAVGSGSHSEGGSIAMGTNAHAEGSATWAAHHGHAEGFMSAAMNTGSHAEGIKNCARGGASHAEGRNTVAEGDASHAEGNQTQALGENSHAEGKNTEAISSATHTEGFGTKAGGPIGTILNGAEVMANYSHAEGYITEARGEAAHAEGWETKAIHGKGVHAEGYYTKASGGHGAHAEGFMTIADGSSAHAEGSYTYAHSGAHAEGNNTTAWHQAHVEGVECVAKGYGTHVEGKGNTWISNSEAVHVEGIGNNSIVKEATSTIAEEWGNDIGAAELSYKYSDSTLSLTYPNITFFNVNEDEPLHTESGRYIFADSVYSYRISGLIDSTFFHCSGLNKDEYYLYKLESELISETMVIQQLSSSPYIYLYHNRGRFWEQNQSLKKVYQSKILKKLEQIEQIQQDEEHYKGPAGLHIQGSYSKLNQNNNFLHVVGNGSSNLERSNAHTIDWDGNAEFAGDVTLFGCGGSDPIRLSTLIKEPLIIQEGMIGAYSEQGEYGNKILDAIQKNRQILILLTNQGGSSYSLYSPVITYHLPHEANTKLSLFYLPDGMSPTNFIIKEAQFMVSNPIIFNDNLKN